MRPAPDEKSSPLSSSKKVIRTATIVCISIFGQKVGPDLPMGKVEIDTESKKEASHDLVSKLGLVHFSSKLSELDWSL
jgi:hypothetical protein